MTSTRSLMDLGHSHADALWNLESSHARELQKLRVKHGKDRPGDERRHGRIERLHIRLQNTVALELSSG